MGFGVWGLGFGVWGLGFGVYQGSGLCFEQKWRGELRRACNAQQKPDFAGCPLDGCDRNFMLLQIGKAKCAVIIAPLKLTASSDLDKGSVGDNIWHQTLAQP